MPRQPYYGIVGNGEICALVSPKGSIEWLCLPKFDGKIVYGRALDPVRGEGLDIKFFEHGKELLVQGTSQRYVSKTAVLQTTVRFEGMTAEITDFMPFNQDAFRNQKSLFRVVRLSSDKLRKIDIKVYSGISQKRYRDIREGIIYSDGSFLGTVFYGSRTLEVAPGKEADFSMAVLYASSKREIEKQLRRARAASPQAELQSCIGFWINWFDRGKKIWFREEDNVSAFYHSLMTLKLLIYRKTGAMAAAPTAAFPATPGGVENWDYRFAWLRDSYFAMRALLRTGHYEEVEKMLEFFFRLQGRDGHWKHPMYTVEGRKLGKEIVVEELTGPNEEESIRISNAAAAQLQLDSEGSMLHGAYLYYLFSGDMDFLKRNWARVKRAAAWVVRNYPREEAGIWESRDLGEHYTYGKVLCYAGLESASKIAAALGKRDEWAAARERLKRYILKNAWSEQRQAFLQTFEKDAPADISALALEDYGLVRPDDPRMRRTVRLIEQKLVKNGGVMRYEDAVLPFYLPTLWLASHYIRAGNKKRAQELIRTCIDSSTDLYLVAEHFDPLNGVQYGNFPQAFNAAMLIEQLLNMKERRSMLRMVKVFELDIEDLIGLFAFDKNKLVQGAEETVG